MVKAVTQSERNAAADAAQHLGETKEQFQGETLQQQDADTIELEEMAALYVSLGGDDPRALKLVQEAKAAGRIDADGNWVEEE